MSDRIIINDDGVTVVTVGVQGPTGVGLPAAGTTGQFLKKASDTDYDTEWSDSPATINSLEDVGDVVLTNLQTDQILKWNNTNWVNADDETGAVAWGGITGTLSDQTDLQTALDNKLESSDLTGYLQDVQEDTAPALGGHLNVLDKEIRTTVLNGNISIQPQGTGDVVLGNYVINGDGATGPAFDGYVLTYDDDDNKFDLRPNTKATWGQVTGTLSSQTDLQTALNNKTKIYTQDTQPGSTTAGDGWFNTLTGTFSVYADGAWQPQTLDGQNF